MYELIYTYIYLMASMFFVAHSERTAVRKYSHARFFRSLRFIISLDAHTNVWEGRRRVCITAFLVF